MLFRSNRGAEDFQLLSLGDKKLYEHVIETSLTWKNSNQLMFVVGATRPDALIKIRNQGISRKLVGITIDCDLLKGPNTTFWPVFKNDKNIGKVTSAISSPRLKKNIALAMVAIENSEIGNKLDVKIADKLFKAKVVEKPFYDPKKQITSKSL